MTPDAVIATLKTLVDPDKVRVDAESLDNWGKDWTKHFAPAPLAIVFPKTVEQVQGHLNPDLGIIGIALTMFDRRNRLTDQVSDDVRECLGPLVFDTVVPRNVRLSEAPSHGLPALVYDQNCPGSRAYMSLARELIGRLPEKRKAA